MYELYGKLISINTDKIICINTDKIVDINTDKSIQIERQKFILIVLRSLKKSFISINVETFLSNIPTLFITLNLFTSQQPLSTNTY